MNQFRIGEIVIGQNFKRIKELNGKKGVIKNIEEYKNALALSIEWEIDFVDGHSCNGFTKENKGRYFYKYYNSHYCREDPEESIEFNLKK